MDEKDFKFITVQCQTEECEYRNEVWHLPVKFNGPFYRRDHWRCKGCGMEPAETSRY